MVLGAGWRDWAGNKHGLFQMGGRDSARIPARGEGDQMGKQSLDNPQGKRGRRVNTVKVLPPTEQSASSLQGCPERAAAGASFLGSARKLSSHPGTQEHAAALLCLGGGGSGRRMHGGGALGGPWQT